MMDLTGVIAVENLFTVQCLSLMVPSLTHSAVHLAGND